MSGKPARPGRSTATLRPANVVLQFDPARDALPNGKRLSTGMSAVAAIGDTLWLTHDETVAVERLRVSATRARLPRYAGHRRFDLREFVTLPAATGTPDDPGLPEADIEGLAYGDRCLWVAGSHSALRDGAEGSTASEAIAALAHVRRSGNRFLLARIPVETGDDGPVLVRRHARGAAQVRTAARLRGGRRNDALTRALKDDPHLGPFLSIPSKDNGFDIEGLAAAPGGRLFLGLRGPVLDGWACVLELLIGTHRLRDHELALQRIAQHAGGVARTRYRKHFLDLGGAGVRDLCLAGRDLLILTGPPMRGKGAAKVRQWRNALGARGECLIHGERLATLLELPYRAKKDHPEGIAVLGRTRNRVRVIVIYDSAKRRRSLPPAAMRATLHDLSLT